MIWWCFWIFLQWHCNKCIPHFHIDSIWFYPRHSFLSPSFVPSSAFASPERVKSHLHAKSASKVLFHSCPSPKNGHQQTRRNVVSQKHQLLNGSSILCGIQLHNVPKAFGFAALLTFFAFTFAGFILPKSQGNMSTQIHRVQTHTILYLYVYIYIHNLHIL